MDGLSPPISSLPSDVATALPVTSLPFSKKGSSESTGREVEDGQLANMETARNDCQSSLETRSVM